MLSSLNHHIAIKPVTLGTVAANCFASGKEEKETAGRPRFDIPAEMQEELRELGFSWIKIGEMLVVSRWTIHRRVEEYDLQNMTGFYHLADEELDEIIRSFISDHGRTTGQGYVGGYIKALGPRIQRKRIRKAWQEWIHRILRYDGVLLFHVGFIRYHGRTPCGIWMDIMH